MRSGRSGRRSVSACRSSAGGWCAFCGSGLFGCFCITRQSRRTVSTVEPDWRSRGLRGLRWRLGSNRTPHARSEPGSLCVHGIAVQGASDGEQSERIAGSFSFVDVSRVQRHGYGISLVGGRVPEFPVDQNRDRNERRFPVRRELHHGQRPGSGVFLLRRFALARRDLRTFLLPRNRQRQGGHAKQRRQQLCAGQKFEV